MPHKKTKKAKAKAKAEAEREIKKEMVKCYRAFFQTTDQRALSDEQLSRFSESQQIILFIGIMNQQLAERLFNLSDVISKCRNIENIELNRNIALAVMSIIEHVEKFLRAIKKAMPDGFVVPEKNKKLWFFDGNIESMITLARLIWIALHNNFYGEDWRSQKNLTFYNVLNGSKVADLFNDMLQASPSDLIKDDQLEEGLNLLFSFSLIIRMDRFYNNYQLIDDKHSEFVLIVNLLKAMVDCLEWDNVFNSIITSFYSIFNHHCRQILEFGKQDALDPKTVEAIKSISLAKKEYVEFAMPLQIELIDYCYKAGKVHQATVDSEIMFSKQESPIAHNMGRIIAGGLKDNNTVQIMEACEQVVNDKHFGKMPVTYQVMCHSYLGEIYDELLPPALGSDAIGNEHYESAISIAEKDLQYMAYMKHSFFYTASLHNLGYNCVFGKGVEKNPERGVALIKKAAGLGNSKAGLHLVDAYAFGWSGKRDIVSALECMEALYADHSTDIDCIKKYCVLLILSKDYMRALQLIREFKEQCDELGKKEVSAWSDQLVAVLEKSLNADSSSSQDAIENCFERFLSLVSDCKSEKFDSQLLCILNYYDEQPEEMKSRLARLVIVSVGDVFHFRPHARSRFSELYLARINAILPTIESHVNEYDFSELLGMLTSLSYIGISCKRSKFNGVLKKIISCLIEKLKIGDNALPESIIKITRALSHMDVYDEYGRVIQCVSSLILGESLNLDVKEQSIIFHKLVVMDAALFADGGNYDSSCTLSTELLKFIKKTIDGYSNADIASKCRLLIVNQYLAGRCTEYESVRGISHNASSYPPSDDNYRISYFQKSIVNNLKRLGYEASMEYGIPPFSIDIAVHKPNCRSSASPVSIADVSFFVEADGPTHFLVITGIGGSDKQSFSREPKHHLRDYLLRLSTGEIKINYIPYYEWPSGNKERHKYLQQLAAVELNQNSQAQFFSPRQEDRSSDSVPGARYSANKDAGFCC